MVIYKYPIDLRRKTIDMLRDCSNPVCANSEQRTIYLGIGRSEISNT